MASGSLDDILSARLKAHEESLKAHRALVDEQRRWLLGSGSGTTAVVAAAASSSIDPGQDEASGAASQKRQRAASEKLPTALTAPMPAATTTPRGRRASSRFERVDAAAPADADAMAPVMADVPLDAAGAMHSTPSPPHRPSDAAGTVFARLHAAQPSERAQRRAAEIAEAQEAEAPHRPHLTRGAPPAAPASHAQRQQHSDPEAQHREDGGGGGGSGGGGGAISVAGALPRQSIEERLLQKERARQQRLEAARQRAEEEQLEREREEREAAARERSRSAARRRSVTILGHTSPSTAAAPATAVAASAASDCSSARIGSEGTNQDCHDALLQQGTAARARQAARADVQREMEELAELQAMQGTPRVSANSHRLALKKRAKDGCTDIDIVDSLLLRDEQSKLEKWARIQQLAAAEVPGRPTISRKAMELAARHVAERTGIDAALPPQDDVSQRLHHNLAPENGRRHEKLRELVEESLDCTFQPAITPRAAQLVRHEGHRVGDDLYEQARLRQERQERRIAAKRHLDEVAAKAQCNPRINPVSELIVSKLQESVQERLCRPKRSAAAAAAAAVQAQEAARHRSPRIDRRSRQLAARQEAMLAHARQDASGGGANSGVAAAMGEAAAGGPSSARQRRVDALHHDAQRRQQRILQAREELLHCATQGLTFQPSITAAAQEIGNAADFLDRADAWAAKRRQRRAEQVDEAARKELEECTFRPELGRSADEDPAVSAHRSRSISASATRRRGGGQVGSSSSINDFEDHHTSPFFSSSFFSSLYGGDGSAWGVHRHVERQAAARRMREEEEEHRARVLNQTTGRNWRPHQLTVPVAPVLGVTPSARLAAAQQADATAIGDAVLQSLGAANHETASRRQQAATPRQRRGAGPAIPWELHYELHHHQQQQHAAPATNAAAAASTRGGGGGGKVEYEAPPSRYHSPLRAAWDDGGGGSPWGASAFAAANPSRDADAGAPMAATSTALENARRALKKANALTLNGALS